MTFRFILSIVEPPYHLSVILSGWSKCAGTHAYATADRVPEGNNFLLAVGGWRHALIIKGQYKTRSLITGRHFINIHFKIISWFIVVFLQARRQKLLDLQSVHTKGPFSFYAAP